MPLAYALYVVLTAFDAAGDGRTPVARSFAGGWPLAPGDFEIDVALPAARASPQSWWRAAVSLTAVSGPAPQALALQASFSLLNGSAPCASAGLSLNMSGWSPAHAFVAAPGAVYGGNRLPAIPNSSYEPFFPAASFSPSAPLVISNMTRLPPVAEDRAGAIYLRAFDVASPALGVLDSRDGGAGGWLQAAPFPGGAPPEWGDVGLTILEEPPSGGGGASFSLTAPACACSRQGCRPLLSRRPIAARTGAPLFSSRSVPDGRRCPRRVAAAPPRSGARCGACARRHHRPCTSCPSRRALLSSQTRPSRPWAPQVSAPAIGYL